MSISPWGLGFTAVFLREWSLKIHFVFYKNLGPSDTVGRGRVTERKNKMNFPAVLGCLSYTDHQRRTANGFDFSLLIHFLHMVGGGAGRPPSPKFLGVPPAKN